MAPAGTGWGMNRKLLDRLCWGASLALVVALFLVLDSYARPSLEGGWGPERRRYFSGTLTRAHQLQNEGRYEVRPEATWLLRGGWEDELVGGRALAVHRRPRLVLPVLRPEPLQIELSVAPLPLRGQEEAVATELEYGLNGVSLGTFVVPAGGGILRFRVDPPTVYRGDNILYLYRLTRRSDPDPWLALASMNVQAVGEGVVGQVLPLGNHVTERFQPFAQDFVHDDLLTSSGRAESLGFGQVRLQILPEGTDLAL